LGILIDMDRVWQGKVGLLSDFMRRRVDGPRVVVGV
jgi:hypothetical protein